jgi:subfamily B ATP-binding cassette protein MsbA
MMFDREPESSDVPLVCLDSLPSLFTRYFRLFWGYARARIVITVLLTLVMTNAEGIGIAMFFPLFETGTSTSHASSTINSLLAKLHVSPTPASVLPLIVGLFLLKGVLQFATLRYQFSMARDVTRQMRRRALDALAVADYQHVAGANAGFYTNLLVTEVNRASGGFLHFVRALSPLVSGAVLFVMVCILDWRLSIACVVMGGVMIAITKIAGLVIRRHSHTITKESAGLTSLLVQMLHAFKYLRSTGSYDRFDRRVWTTSERLLEADFKSATASSFLVSMSQPIMVVFLGGILYYRAVIQGGELASLFVLLLYFFRIMNEVFTLQSAWQSFCGFVGSVDQTRAVTAETEGAAERQGDVVFDGLSDAIVLDHVTFSYKTGRRVLDDVALRIPANSTIAFVGESGSGKSTLVDLLTGMLKASSGSVKFDDQDLATMKLETLRTHVGYVTQDAVLFDDTVGANIAMWSDTYTQEQIRDAATRARCSEFIERMPEGFDTQIGDRGVKLSGGQRQRIAIARELLRSPQILILDEATSALDSESELAIQQSIDQLKGQMTIIIIAHRLSTIRGADRVYVLDAGKVVEDGVFDELASRPNGRFRRMVELQEVTS